MTYVGSNNPYLLYRGLEPEPQPNVVGQVGAAYAQMNVTTASVLGAAAAAPTGLTMPPIMFNGSPAVTRTNGINALALMGGLLGVAGAVAGGVAIANALSKSEGSSGEAKSETKNEWKTLDELRNTNFSEYLRLKELAKGAGQTPNTPATIAPSPVSVEPTIQPPSEPVKQEGASSDPATPNPEVTPDQQTEPPEQPIIYDGKTPLPLYQPPNKPLPPQDTQSPAGDVFQP